MKRNHPSALQRDDAETTTCTAIFFAYDVVAVSRSKRRFGVIFSDIAYIQVQREFTGSHRGKMSVWCFSMHRRVCPNHMFRQAAGTFDGSCTSYIGLVTTTIDTYERVMHMLDASQHLWQLCRIGILHAFWPQTYFTKAPD